MTTQEPSIDTKVMAQPAQTNKGKGQPKKNFPRPPNKVDKSGPPKPQHLSKSQTRLTNDPLWKDYFIIDGETGFSNETAAKDYHPGASGFVTLIEQEYKAITDVDKHYAKSVPASAYAYYHGIIYWYELALIAQRHGMSNADQDRLVHFVQGYPSAQIAAGAAEYFEGLGDFTDATGVKHLLAVPEVNELGHFGLATQAGPPFERRTWIGAPTRFVHVEQLAERPLMRTKHRDGQSEPQTSHETSKLTKILTQTTKFSAKKRKKKTPLSL